MLLLDTLGVASDEVVKRATCVVVQEGLDLFIDRGCLISDPLDIRLVSVLLILIPLLQAHTLSCTIVCDKLLETVAQPDIEKAKEAHASKPVSSIVDRTSSIKPMHGKHTSNCDSPLESLVGATVPE